MALHLHEHVKEMKIKGCWRFESISLFENGSERSWALAK